MDFGTPTTLLPAYVSEKLTAFAAVISGRVFCFGGHGLRTLKCICDTVCGIP